MIGALGFTAAVFTYAALLCGAHWAPLWWSREQT